MKKLLYLFFMIFIQSCLIGSGENSKIMENKIGYFPKVTGINLEGEKKDLPQAFSGELNFVVVAFEREQQEVVNTWINAVDEIIKDNEKIKFYEIPLIYELGSFSRGWINNGMRFGISDKKSRQRTITVYTDRKKFFEMMKINGNRIQVFLIDKNGKILFRTEGEAQKEKINDIKKFLNRIS